MRLWRLHLENYVNIYNGMGLRTLDIDFSKCRNKLLIKVVYITVYLHL